MLRRGERPGLIESKIKDKAMHSADAITDRSFTTIEALSAASLDDSAARASGGSMHTLVVGFSGDGSERPFTKSDAIMMHRLANLPLKNGLLVAYIEGLLGGADLAFALTCPFVIMQNDAMLQTGFGHPGSAAVYLTASRRLGPILCEKILFGRESITSSIAEEALLSVSVKKADEIAGVLGNKAITLLSVAKANLITWPVLEEAMLALVDER